MSEVWLFRCSTQELALAARRGTYRIILPQQPVVPFFRPDSNSFHVRHLQFLISWSALRTGKSHSLYPASSLAVRSAVSLATLPVGIPAREAPSIILWDS